MDEDGTARNLAFSDSKLQELSGSNIFGCAQQVPPRHPGTIGAASGISMACLAGKQPELGTAGMQGLRRPSHGPDTRTRMLLQSVTRTCGQQQIARGMPA